MSPMSEATQVAQYGRVMTEADDQELARIRSEIEAMIGDAVPATSHLLDDLVESSVRDELRPVGRVATIGFAPWRALWGDSIEAIANVFAVGDVNGGESGAIRRAVQHLAAASVALAELMDEAPHV